jgi:hypothetical protein
MCTWNANVFYCLLFLVLREYAAHVPVRHPTRPSETCNSDASYQTRSWSFCALCFLPMPPCCLPALSNSVLTGELLKTAIGYTVLLPNYQICTCYLSNKPFFILNKCYKCIVPLLLVRNKNLCLMSYVLEDHTFLCRY